MFPYTAVIVVYIKNDKAVNVSYEDVWSRWLQADLRTVISYKYLIVQMLRVYYVDGVVVAEAREQWKNSRRKENTGSCQTVSQSAGC